MLESLKSTRGRKDIPSSVRWALVVAFFATLAASFLDKGIAVFVTPVASSVPSDPLFVVSKQAAPFSSPNIFLGWNFFVQSGDSVLNTMKTVLASSSVIPNLDSKKVYKPVTSGYSVTCEDFRVQLEGEAARNSSGCATVSFLSEVLGKQFIRTERSPGRGSIIVPIPIPEVHLLNKPLDVNFEFKSIGSCSIVESYRSAVANIYEGFSSFPTTTATKCFYNTSDITAIAMTTTRFIILDDRYNALGTNSYLKESDDELILAMKETTKTTTMPSSPGQPQNQTAVGLWVEYRLTKSNIEIFACQYGGRDEKVECIYSTARMLQFTQPLKDAIAKLGIQHYTSTSSPSASSYMTFETFTGVVKEKDANNWRAAPASLERMKKDTIDVADYMADLGYNYFAEFTQYQGEIFILYNVEDLKSGLEVPFWVLVVAGIILATSFLLWQITNQLVGSPHNSSLYSIIRARLASASNTSLPKTLRFRFEPLMLEDVKLLPDQVEHPPNKAEVDAGHTI
ncbi:hypothetical protein BGX34_000239 [Mortierella sp. NVP85]|nr:hypothetical protein BGX34_000239 [Mortierella sp. NVP85]